MEQEIVKAGRRTLKQKTECSIEFFHGERFILCVLIVFTILIVVLCGVLSWREMRIVQIDMAAYDVTTDNEDISYYVDNAYYDISVDVQKIYISGWCVKKGVNQDDIQMHIVLIDNAAGVFYKLPTAIKIRPDVTSHFADGYNYDYSGFIFNAECDKFDFKKDTFEVAILYTNKGETSFVRTEKFVKQKISAVEVAGIETETHSECSVYLDKASCDSAGNIEITGKFIMEEKPE